MKLNLNRAGLMDDLRRPRSLRRALTVFVMSAGLVSGCARSRPPADTLASTALIKDTALYSALVWEHGRTVFTDTALFRRLCVEADSGLTARTAGKCTPRDQSLRWLPRERPPRER